MFPQEMPQGILVPKGLSDSSGFRLHSRTYAGLMVQCGWGDIQGLGDGRERGSLPRKGLGDSKNQG